MCKTRQGNELHTTFFLNFSASMTTSYAPPEISNNYSARNVSTSKYRTDQLTSSAATTYLHDSYHQPIPSYSTLPRNKTTRR